MTKRQRELGDLLRSRRTKLNPEAVGIPGGQRRRTPGLRREEVAELAGISVDWYIRLEQGRAVSPSATTIDSLARVLRCSGAEHAHLRALAHGSEHRTFERERVPAALERFVKTLGQPAYVTNQRWDVLAWNAAAADVLTDFGQVAVKDRNILVYAFLNPESRDRFGATWTDEAKRIVAQFRIAYDLWADDPGFCELLERLNQDSPEFASWWETHDIRRLGITGQKRLTHPSKGVLEFEYVTFQANDNPALKLAVYTPVLAEI